MSKILEEKCTQQSKLEMLKKTSKGERRMGTKYPFQIKLPSLVTTIFLVLASLILASCYFFLKLLEIFLLYLNISGIEYQIIKMLYINQERKYIYRKETSPKCKKSKWSCKILLSNNDLT